MREIPIVTFLCLLLLASVSAVSVTITKEWETNFGWTVTCHWDLGIDDALQSVALSRNRQQFFLLRPDVLDGTLSKSNTFNLTDSRISVDCMSAVEKGIRGRCVFTSEPNLPPTKDFTFSCAVSGERPFFKFAEREVTVEALVPPTDAVMVVTRSESGPPTINCTASGIPAPRILWTVDNQTVPHFHDSTAHWNTTSKLWDVWSSFIPPADSATKVQCTPEVLKGQSKVKGLSAQYNNAYRIYLDGLILTLAALSSLLLHV